MTECQRLITEGFLPESYINTGGRITTATLKTRALQLDLVKQVEKICTKHDLNYFACGGTLIGAVRHGGFIPWDDDLDIVMKRKDYDKFLEIGQEELDSVYFLQTPLTDQFFYRPHAILRNSCSTCITKWDSTVRFHAIMVLI